MFCWPLLIINFAKELKVGGLWFLFWGEFWFLVGGGCLFVWRSLHLGGTHSGQVTSHKQPVYNSGWFPWSRNSQTCPLSFWWDLYHLIPSRLGIFSHPLNLVKWNFPCVSSELRKLFWKKKKFLQPIIFRCIYPKMNKWFKTLLCILLLPSAGAVDSRDHLAFALGNRGMLCDTSSGSHFSSSRLVIQWPYLI